MTSVTSYAKAENGTGAITDTLTYDITGNVVTESSSCCQLRNYTYTSEYQFAYPEIITSGSGSTQLANSAIYDFDTGAIRSSTDQNNQTTTLHYYPESLRLYETVRPDGGITDIIYFGDQLFADPDAEHQHSAVMSVTTLDEQRTVRSWRFSDGAGQMVRTFGEAVGQGHTGARFYEYDAMGRVSRVSNPYYAPYSTATAINPTGYWTSYAYDPLGRVNQVTLADSNVIQTTYSDTATTVTNQANNQRRQILDALGRVVELDEPNSAGTLDQATFYQYDALDNLVKITQGTEQQRSFKYDSLSRLTYERQVEQDAPHFQADTLTGNNYWSKRIEYNSDGLVTNSWDARNVRTSASYDGLNRLSQITYTGETSPITPTVTYTYDEQRAGYFNRGALTTIATSAVTGATSDVPQTIKAFDYDRMGRVQSQRQTIGATTYTVGYSYNLLGQLRSQTYPSGREVTNTYDAAARLSGISDAGQTYVNNYVYAPHGGLASETWGNGATHTISYNSRLQISQIKLAFGSVEKQRFDYAYGAVNVDTAALDTSKNTGQVAVVDGWINGVKQWQQRYAYDKLGRLSTAKELNNDQTGSQAWRSDYTYDRWGNRYQAAGQDGTPVVDGDIDKTRNRFVTVGSTLMIYDAAGNLTIDQKFRGLQYGYDSNGRMRRTDSTTGYSTAAYDGSGQRVQTFEAVQNLTRHVVYDLQGQIIADYENGSWKRDYVYNGGVLIATVPVTGSTRYVLLDHQGSARAVADSTQIVERHDYKPFGEEISSAVGLRAPAQGYGAADPVRPRFSLTERDSTGLDHALFRKLEIRSGRWTSPDPYHGSMSLDDPQSFNRYVYVRNDPLNFVDPSGLFWQLSYCYMEVKIDNEGRINFTGNEGCVYTWVNISAGSSVVPNIPGVDPQKPPRTCDELQKEITRLKNQLSRRERQIRENRGNLRATGPNSIASHQQRFRETQTTLRNALDEWNSQGCGGGLPKRIWKLATKDAPQPAPASTGIGPQRRVVNEPINGPVPQPLPNPPAVPAAAAGATIIMIILGIAWLVFS